MKKILMIDDDEDLCHEFIEVVVSRGYEVVCENDGLKGLKRAMGDSFELVLLDLKMGGMMGRDVLMELKDKKPDLKVLILTGSPINPALLDDSNEDMGNLFPNSRHYNDEFLKLADGVMNKPFDVDAVLAKIEDLLKK